MSTASFSAAITVDCTWTELKEACALKVMALQWTQTGGSYSLFALDGPILYRCNLLTVATSADGRFVDGYTREQNDLDVVEFETSYKATSNAALSLRTRDGREVVRGSTANRTLNFKLRAITFYTADLVGGLHSVNPVTSLPYGDITVRLFREDGSEIEDAADEAEAVRTQLDFDPTYDYEIIGGFLDIPADLKGGTTDQWYISAIGVPDYPPAYFGQIDFISEVNVEAVVASRVNSDGRAISYLPYNYGGAPHTNRLRFTVKHPVGGKKRFQLFIEHFTS